MISINHKQMADELATERRKVSEFTEDMRAQISVVNGVESRMVNTELTAKVAAAVPA